MPLAGMAVEQLGAWATQQPKVSSARERAVSISHPFAGSSPNLTQQTTSTGPAPILISDLEMGFFAARGSTTSTGADVTEGELDVTRIQLYRPNLARRFTPYLRSVRLREMTHTAERGVTTVNIGLSGSTVDDVLHRLHVQLAMERPFSANLRVLPGLRSNLPLASVIWAMVERQQIRAARELLTYLPDEPQYERLRTLVRPPTTSNSAYRDVDRTADYIWLREHGNEYAGRWVALSGGALLTSANSLRELRQQLRANPPESLPLIHFLE